MGDTIASKLTRIDDCKIAMKNAIEAKGISMSGVTRLEDYPGKIFMIPSSYNGYNNTPTPTTTYADNVMGKLGNVIDCKNAIKDVIISKGVYMDDTVKLDDYASKIMLIEDNSYDDYINEYFTISFDNNTDTKKIYIYI